MQGHAMVVDGTPGEEVENIMRRDMMATLQRHGQGGAILKKMAEFAPAMGRSVQSVWCRCSVICRPASIGRHGHRPVDDLCGAVLANMVLMPMASKLERNSAEEALVNSIYVLGATSIGRGKIQDGSRCC